MPCHLEKRNDALTAGFHPDLLAQAPGAREIIERRLEDRGDFSVRGTQGGQAVPWGLPVPAGGTSVVAAISGRDDADDRMQAESADGNVERREGSERAHACGIKTDLLVGLPQGGLLECLARIHGASRERNLATMPLQGIRPNGQHDGCGAVEELTTPSWLDKLIGPDRLDRLDKLSGLDTLVGRFAAEQEQETRRMTDR